LLVAAQKLRSRIISQYTFPVGAFDSPFLSRIWTHEELRIQEALAIPRMKQNRRWTPSLMMTTMVTAADRPMTPCLVMTNPLTTLLMGTRLPQSERTGWMKASVRQPILALIQMVHHFAHDSLKALEKEHNALCHLKNCIRSGDLIEDEDFIDLITSPRISDVTRETINEHIAVNQTGKKILKHLGLTWRLVCRELDDCSKDWACPGEIIELSFLKNVIVDRRSVDRRIRRSSIRGAP
jgi:hypothetical protein